LLNTIVKELADAPHLFRILTPVTEKLDVTHLGTLVVGSNQQTVRVALGASTIIAFALSI
jgi:hypothetical protein